MEDSKKIESIRKITEELLAKMAISGKIKAKIIDQDNQELIWVNIEAAEDPRFLIGQKGSNLASLQHIIRLMIRRELPAEKVNFAIDVNQYKEKRLGYLRKLAQTSALKVQRSEKPLVLNPMPAHERRAIHLALANSEEVSTESTGEEEERRVVIKPQEK